MSSRCSLAFTILVLGCSPGNPGSPSATTTAALTSTSTTPLDIEATRAEVRAVFLGYRSAIVAQRGQEAVRFVSAKTLDRYEEMRVAMLHMPEAKLRAAPLIDKMMILITRARMTRGQLEGMNGKDLFALGVDRGWIGDDVAQLEPAEIRIDGDTARIGLRRGTSTLPSAAGFRAYREGPAWKLDVLSIERIAEPALRAMLAQLGDDEDQALEKLIAIIAEAKVGPQIWQPLAK